MRVLSVNVSLPKIVEYGGETVETGIYKEPVAGRLMLRKLNLDGDRQADLRVHGGVDKAVYVYSIENYEYWKQELGRDDFNYGQFGENFTVEGMTDDVIRIGDVFRVGDASVQVTQPRMPCYKLAIKMENPKFPKLFLLSRRTGFYLQVLEEGEVGAGDEFELIERDPEPLTVEETIELYFFDPDNLVRAQAALRVKTLPSGWREGFEDRLREAGIAAGAEAALDDCCGPSA
jgi:MOSC domain-containing protein YiiM